MMHPEWAVNIASGISAFLPAGSSPEPNWGGLIGYTAGRFLETYQGNQNTWSGSVGYGNNSYEKFNLYLNSQEWNLYK